MNIDELKSEIVAIWNRHELNRQADTVQIDGSYSYREIGDTGIVSRDTFYTMVLGLTTGRSYRMPLMIQPLKLIADDTNLLAIDELLTEDEQYRLTLNQLIGHFREYDKMDDRELFNYIYRDEAAKTELETRRKRYAAAKKAESAQ